MSFCARKKVMNEGDVVILYLDKDTLCHINLKRGNVFNSRFGILNHDQLIGYPYGQRVHCSNGLLYPIQPSPDLWTLTLPHRTQILYTPDVSMIIFELCIKPGSVVAEAGEI